ncbi:MAG: trypsin-like serine protease [Pirellulaceae bacterium]|nr:trypsin-like serine protease [Pirellulaceae bacterium]
MNRSFLSPLSYTLRQWCRSSWMLACCGFMVVSMAPSESNAIGTLTQSDAPGQIQPKIVRYGGQEVPVYKTIMAGDPSHFEPDMPDDRIDPNVSTSPFRGVGSLRIIDNSTTYICSGTSVSLRHVVTAAHCFDLDEDGIADVSPNDVTYFLNDGSDLSTSNTATHITIHPNFSGFANPVLNDDIAVVTLDSILPAGSKTYPLRTDPVLRTNTLTLVGYGRSGDGVSGDYVSASFSVKRTGQNIANTFQSNDEAPFTLVEVYAFDFDFPPEAGGGTGSNPFPSLGNRLETTIGGGDSGGPAFIEFNGQFELAGINTYSRGGGGSPAVPLFGSGGGGILIPPYRDWVLEQIPEPTTGLLGQIGLLLGWLFRPRIRRRT